MFDNTRVTARNLRPGVLAAASNISGAKLPPSVFKEQKAGEEGCGFFTSFEVQYAEWGG
jgi:hypothetical protein